MPVIGLDAGHGGRDPGAVGPSGGLLEKEVNLGVALALEELLKAKGWSCYLTRRDDTYLTLKERVDRLNAQPVELVLSLHVNSAPQRDANYLATFIYQGGGRAAEAAACCQRRLVQATGWLDGGVRPANFYLLRETRAPALLVELGFISHADQEAWLARPENREVLARALAQGLEDFYGPLAPEPFTDLAGHWAREIILRARDLGLVEGYPDGTFRPDQPATRAEVAQVALRLWDKLAAGSARPNGE